MTHDPTCDLSSGAAGFCSCVRVLAAPCKVCLKTHEMPKCVETDIVKRLRSRPDRRADPDGIAEDAADEIEKLRGELKSILEGLVVALGNAAWIFHDGILGRCPRDEYDACLDCGSQTKKHREKCAWPAFDAAAEAVTKFMDNEGGTK